MSENFARLLEAGARSAPGALALSWDSGTLTWAALDLRAGGVARALSARGVRAGETVVVSLPNGWPFAAALRGALKLGATVTPLNPLLTGEERMRIVEDLRPAAIVEETGADEAAVASVEAAPAPALILYTSGSTGEPKGVVLSHEALTFANRSWIGPVMGLTAADVVLAALPLSHSFGLNGALLAPLLARASVVLLDHFSPEAALGAIAHHRVTVFPGVAAMFRRMLDAPAMATADLGSLRAVVSGAAPCPWELAREWRERTGVRIIRGYGSTELFRPISHLAGDPRDEPESVGRPVPGVEIAVVDEAGRALPRGEVGELWIRTPAAMEGYLHRPEETRAVLADGWFRTGDLVTVSPDGHVRIVGRKRELILRGGYSVVPAEVEAMLLAHPAVAEAAVVGLPHPELGEEVAAFVTLRPGAASEPDELIAHCKARLAGFKYPRQVRIVARLPKSATGKILKSRLR
ncbi:MAG: AMP-binding protein [Candidatus Rokubacteria bacterium]|nr:AMP-binding protein [Candidatus Rokubacteria bacterium]